MGIVVAGIVGGGGDFNFNCFDDDDADADVDGDDDNADGDRGFLVPVPSRLFFVSLNNFFCKERERASVVYSVM